MTFEKSLITILFAVGLAAPTVASAQAASPAKAKIEFRVCRAPGLDASTNEDAIEIPAGTEYDESRPAPENGGGAQPDKRRPSLAVITTEAEALPANGYCVTVPAKPRGNIDPSAQRASIGAMFEPSSNWRAPAAPGINLTYGYWQSPQD